MSNIKTSTTSVSYTYKYKTERFIKSKLQNKRNPRIIIINTYHRKVKLDLLKKNYDINPHYKIENPHQSIIDLQSTIIYNGEEYILDSVILPNWNTSEDIVGHTIAGITCKNERYVFNGWTRYTTDPAMTHTNNMQRIPCEFMKYDWNPQRDKDFCISKKRCALDKATVQDLDTRMCFSFSRGSRNLIYIKKSALTNLDHLDLPNTPEHVPYKARVPKIRKLAKCQKGKIRNPITRRCILLKTAEQRGIIRKQKIKHN